MAKSRFEEANVSVAKSVRVGVMQRSNQMLDELNRAERLIDSILGMLSGEGHAEQEQPLHMTSLEGMIDQSSQLACQIGLNLERIAETLDPSYNKPRQVGKGQ